LQAVEKEKFCDVVLEMGNFFTEEGKEVKTSLELYEQPGNEDLIREILDIANNYAIVKEKEEKNSGTPSTSQ